jgi:hypothetical protein
MDGQELAIHIEFDQLSPGEATRAVQELRQSLRERVGNDLVSSIEQEASDTQSAKLDIIRDRLTHTKTARDAFSGYDRGAHWIEACGEVSKRRLRRRVATAVELSGL